MSTSTPTYHRFKEVTMEGARKDDLHDDLLPFFTESSNDIKPRVLIDFLYKKFTNNGNTFKQLEADDFFYVERDPKKKDYVNVFNENAYSYEYKEYKDLINKDPLLYNIYNTTTSAVEKNILSPEMLIVIANAFQTHGEKISDMSRDRQNKINDCIKKCISRLPMPSFSTSAGPTYTDTDFKVQIIEKLFDTKIEKINDNSTFQWDKIYNSKHVKEISEIKKNINIKNLVYPSIISIDATGRAVPPYPEYSKIEFTYNDSSVSPLKATYVDSARGFISYDSPIYTTMYNNIDIQDFKVYVSTIIAVQANSSIYNSISNSRLLTFLMTRPFIKYNLADFVTSHSSKGVSTSVLELIPDDCNTSASPLCGIYFRKEGKNYLTNEVIKNALWKKDSDGSIKEVHRFSEEFGKLSNSPCYNILNYEYAVPSNLAGIQSQNQKCTDLIINCIHAPNDESIAKCKSFMQQPTYFEQMNKEVYNEMLPYFALLILKKFGFTQINDDLEYTKNYNSNTPLLKIEEYDSWIKKLLENKELNTAEVKNIQDNIPLKQYLHALIKKINCNPIILNENYQGINGVEVDATPQNIYYANIKTKPTRMIVAPTASYGESMRYISGFKPFGAPIINPFGFMVGGDLNEILQKVPRKADIFKNVYNNFKNALKELNKQITAEDEAVILNSINSLGRTEDKIKKLMLVIDRYTQLHNIYKENDPHNLLNMDDIEAFNKTKEQLVIKHEKKITNLETLLNVINKSISDNMQATAQPSVRPMTNLHSSEIDVTKINT